MNRSGHQSGGATGSEHGRVQHTPTIVGVPLGPFDTNCYIVNHPASDECWIVDAGLNPGALIDEIRRRRLRPVAVVLTHAHWDHIAGLWEVRKAFPEVPILIHEAERAWLADPLLNLSAAVVTPMTAPEASQLLRDGDELTLAGERWKVLHTPGHSPGGLTLWHEPSATALVGDALFAGSVGRTDFPGSDPQVLANSIRTRLYTLPDKTRVYPGHGPETTIGREKASNPFVRP